MTATISTKTENGFKVIPHQPTLDLLKRSGIRTDKSSLVKQGISWITDYEQLPPEMKMNMTISMFESDAPFIMFKMVGLASDGGRYDAYQIRSHLYSIPEAERTRFQQPRSAKGIQSGKGSHILMTEEMYKRFQTLTGKFEDEDAPHEFEPEPWLCLGQEGTRQGIVASEAALKMKNVLVFVVWGCTNWTDGNGMPHKSLDQLFRGAKGLWISLDGDRKSNHDVWAGAVGLRDHALAMGINAKNVKFVTIPSPGSSKAGMDDYLGRTPSRERGKTLAALMRTAVLTPGREPKRKKSALTAPSQLAPIVDLERGIIREANRESDYGVSEGRVLAEFTAELVEVNRSIDDKKGGRDVVTGTLVVTLPGQNPYTLRDVDDADLSNPKAWLSQVPRGSTAIYDDSPAGRAAIGMAIRSHGADDRIENTIIRRLGWYTKPETGDEVYATPDGGFGPLGLDTSVRSRLATASYQRAVSIPDVTEATEAARHEAIAAFIEAPDLFVDPTPWLATVSLAIAAVHGAKASGALGLIGPPGSGKTHIAQSVCSLWGAGLGYKRAILGASLRTGTHGVHLDIGAGLHNSIMLMEDARRLPSAREQDKQSEAIAAFITRAYDGTGSRGRIQLDGNSWGQAEGDASAPLGLITGESIADMALIVSSEQRILPIMMTRHSTYKDDLSTSKMEVWGEEGVMALSMGIIIEAILEIKAETKEAGKNYDKDVLGAAKIQAEAVMKKALGKNVDPRQFKTASGVVAGFILARNVISEVARMNEYNGLLGAFDGRKNIADTEFVAAIVSASQAHWGSMKRRSESPADTALAHVVSAVMNGSILLLPAHAPKLNNDLDRGRLAGLHTAKVKDLDGTDVDVVLIDAVTMATKMPMGRLRDADALREAMATISVPSAKSYGHRATINGTRIAKLIAIPAKVFGPVDYQTADYLDSGDDDPQK